MTIEDAYHFAAKCHGNQEYGDQPYIWHLIQVQLSVNRARYDETHQIVAILHDTLEDTAVTEGEIATLFGTTVSDAVVALTCYMKGDGYFEKVKRNPIAKVVKIHDAMCNMEASIKSQDLRRVKKYANTLSKLLDA